jgi:hypothetical protein
MGERVLKYFVEIQQDERQIPVQLCKKGTVLCWEWESAIRETLGSTRDLFHVDPTLSTSALSA